jgi:hypothetical protein
VVNNPLSFAKILTFYFGLVIEYVHILMDMAGMAATGSGDLTPSVPAILTWVDARCGRCFKPGGRYVFLNRVVKRCGGFDMLEESSLCRHPPRMNPISIIISCPSTDGAG